MSCHKFLPCCRSLFYGHIDKVVVKLLDQVFGKVCWAKLGGCLQERVTA